MSKKVIAVLNKYGPMLSGEAARAFEKEYGVSNAAARQALSRARGPVNKIQALSFDKNQKFFYLETQYMSGRYVENLLGAIQKSSQINWIYICALDAQSGYASKDLLAAMVSAPVQRVRGHKLHERVLEDLLQCRIIEEYDETHWKLCDWVCAKRGNAARAAGLETAKKQVAGDFARWAAKLNLIGYDSAKTLAAPAEFAHFQWALTAPSYVQPLYDAAQRKPGFVVADVFYGQRADVEHIRFFRDKLSIIRSFKKLPAVFPVLLAESVTPEALKALKDDKVTVALIKNIFDEEYTRLLSEIVGAFTNASAMIAKNPGKLETLFREIAKSEGRYNDIIGDMLELLAGYYYQHIGCRYLEIRKRIQIPDTALSNEIDVLAEREGQIIVVECKATRAAVGAAFVGKWLSETIGRILSWLRARYPDGRAVTFQLWSLGGFTPDAADMLASAAKKTNRYAIEFFDKAQIIEMARSQKAQPVVDVLQQHF